MNYDSNAAASAYVIFKILMKVTDFPRGKKTWLEER